MRQVTSTKSSLKNCATNIREWHKERARVVAQARIRGQFVSRAPYVDFLFNALNDQSTDA
ncbi:hypothetical protein HK099_005747 [Clydaea vesicula]|uniref:Uncharacterized protein n=1 Tax=Clydaea vesicula TaxID=447962 RepID=A0AAD5U171_9FUNG|nr:hypothetical protein HK099_005747 [Clydaea vesicula]